MELSASHEVKVALAAARRMRRPMPLLRAILAAADPSDPIDHAGALLVYGPDYAAVLAALLARPAEAASGAVRRSVSPLRAVASSAPERLPRGGGETGRAPGASTRQAGTLRAVADPRPPARPPAAPAMQRGDIARARAEVRRGRLGGGHSGVTPAAAAIERRAADGADGGRPAAIVAPPALGQGRAPDPVGGGGVRRGGAAWPAAAAVEPRPAYSRRPADPEADVSPESAEARAAAFRAAALGRGATIVEDSPAGPAASTDRAARRERPGSSAGGKRGRAAESVAGAAPLAAVPAPIAPPARPSPDSGAVSPVPGEPAARTAVSPPARRHDPAKLDDSGTALAEAAWRNGVDAT